MDWNALKLFLAIAEGGSLAAAAKKLSVNHSTVFRRLNGLEQKLGGRLFERHAHGYELTTTGEGILALAQNISSEFDDLERRVLGKDIAPNGVVKITAPNNIAYRFLPAYLAEFNEHYPDIRIELLVSNQEFNMNNRQADIAVRATPNPPEHLIGKPLRDVKWGVYCGEAYAKKFSLPERLEELQEHELIGGSGSMIDLPSFSWLEKNFSAQIQVRCDDLVSMSYFTEAGLGLAFLPDDQQRQGIQRLFTFTPGDVSKLWLLIHPDLRNVGRIKLVMQFLASKFREDDRL